MGVVLIKTLDGFTYIVFSNWKDANSNFAPCAFQALFRSSSPLNVFLHFALSPVRSWPVVAAPPSPSSTKRKMTTHEAASNVSEFLMRELSEDSERAGKASLMQHKSRVCSLGGQGAPASKVHKHPSDGLDLLKIPRSPH